MKVAEKIRILQFFWASWAFDEYSGCCNISSEVIFYIHRLPCFTNKFLSIKSDFNPVVKKSKKGCQRKCCHKDGDESKLKY